MLQLLLSVVNGLLFAGFLYFGGRFLYGNRKASIKKTIIAVAIYVISFVVNIYNFTQLFTIFFFYISIVIFYKKVFEQSLTESLLSALIIYIARMTIEIILVVFNIFQPEVICAVNSLSIEKFCSNPEKIIGIDTYRYYDENKIYIRKLQ